MEMFDLSLNTHLNFPRNFEDQQDSGGACSPPLWRTTSPQKESPCQKQINNYQKKAQIIARGQKELMEMVSKLPESCYELSLKDLVEVNTEEQEEEDKVLGEMTQTREKTTNTTRVVRKMKSDPRGVNKNGFLLNLGFSVSFGAKRKTKTKTKKKDDDDDGDCSATCKSSWISPRRSVSDLSESRRIQRRVSRINSGASRSNSDRSRNNIRDENNGCLSFLWNVHLRD